MGWLRTIFLGDIGNRLDIADTERDIDTLRGQLRAKRERDRDQDQRIAALERENETLKLCLSELARLLREKNVLGFDDLEQVVQRIEPE